MVCCVSRVAAIAVCVVCISRADDAVPKEAPGDSKPIEGLWQGSWGGGGADGVMMQPVVAELFVHGDKVELCQFPKVGSLTGTIRVDTSAKKMRVSPRANAADQLAPKPIEYTYEIKGEQLTLTSSDNDKASVSFGRCRMARDALANARVELVAATGINAEGDLLVTRFTVLRSDRAGATYFHPHDGKLKTKQATVLLVQKARLKDISVGEARALIGEPMLVVIACRPDDRRPPQGFFGGELFRDIGPPMPDNDSVIKTFSSVLRPGTLVFIVSARENAVLP